jgi:hypothetical protein
LLGLTFDDYILDALLFGFGPAFALAPFVLFAELRQNKRPNGCNDAW